MSIEKQPSSHHLNGEQHNAENHVKSGNPTYDTKVCDVSHRVYPHTVPPPSTWIQFYLLIRKPWIFVPVIGSYWVLSVTQLVAKLSTFSVASVAISTFVLVLAITHNIVEVLDCLGTIFRQIGVGLRATGKAFRFIGHMLRRVARRLKMELGEVRRMR